MRNIFAVIVFLYLGSAFGQNEKIYFPNFELIGLSKDGELQYSTSKLAKTYIESNHKYHIMLAEHDGTTYLGNETFDQSVNFTQKANITLIMTGEIHNLDGHYIISIAVYDAKTGEKKWSDMIKGLTNDDLDLLLARLGRTFMTKSKARDDIELGEVTKYEQQGVEMQQIKANHYFGVLLGANAPFNDNTQAGFGFGYSFDASTIIFTLGLDFYRSSRESSSNTFGTNTNSNMQSFSMGVVYPLNRKRNSWFITGGIDYSSYTKYLDLQDDKTTNQGMGLYVGGGYLINRNSTVNMRIQTSVYVPTYEVAGQYQSSFKLGLTTSISN
jgi:hypothetical protein